MNRYVFRYEFHPLFDHYLNDILAVPILLHAISISMGFVYGRIPFKLTIWQVIVPLLMLIFLFELALPKISIKYTSDFLDILAYTLGLGIYLIHQNK